MPSAWQTMKEKVTEGLGYYGKMREIAKAAKVFVELIPYFANPEKEKEAFNADSEEILKALSIEKNFKDLGY